MRVGVVQPQLSTLRSDYPLASDEEKAMRLLIVGGREGDTICEYREVAGLRHSHGVTYPDREQFPTRVGRWTGSTESRR